MKNLTFKQKQDRQLGALENSLNYYKKNYPEWENAFIKIDERRKNKNRCFILHIPTVNGLYYNSSGLYTYEEMNAFIHGYFIKFVNDKITLRGEDKNKPFTL
jgi:hypothetical protein